MDKQNVERCVDVYKGTRYIQVINGVDYPEPERSTDRVALRGHIFTGSPARCKELKAILIPELSSMFEKLEASGFEFNEIRESQAIFPEE